MDNFHSESPIYAQLMERIYRQIMRNEMKAGDKLLSVREMAIQAGVNPNTIQRTYRELEQQGIVETKRGQGTFITEDEKKLSELRETLKDKYISTFLKDMSEMGFTDEEILLGLKSYLSITDERGEDKHD